MSVTSLRDVSERLPQVGRIRTGRPGNRGPVALSKFRFTSPSRELIAKVAEVYGGTPQAWDTNKSDDRYEVYSEADEIKVVLAPDPFDRNWELWAGSTIKRRCDNKDCVVTIPGPDGPEQTIKPCICQQRGIRECEVVSRLNVILPNVRGLSVWRLDTKSWNAAEEMPAMVRAIEAVDQGRSMVRAVLRIEPRHRVIETTKGKQRRNFMVPVLDFDASLDEIVAGEARVSIGSGPAPGPRSTAGVGPAASGELPRGPAPYVPLNADDEVIDAEIVGEVHHLRSEETEIANMVENWAETLDPRDRSKILRQARAVAQSLGEPVPANWNAITGPTLEAIFRALDEED